MARYYTGGYANQEALMQAVDAVLTDGTGLNWNQNELDLANDEAGWNDGANFFVQADWDNSADINFYQSTAWDGAGTAPGAHTGDSGSSCIVNAIGNGAGTYYAFTNDGVGVDFAYFVIEYDTGFFRHFGFYNIEMDGLWAGGEGIFGHRWDQGGTIDEPNASVHSVLVDGQTVASSNAAVLRCAADLPNKPASAVWGISHLAATLGNDGDGNGRYRLKGGMRRGPYCQCFAFIDAQPTDAFIPGSIVPIFAVDPTYSSPEHWIPLGQLPLLYVGSMDNFTDKQEIAFGGETWKVFPVINSVWSAGSGLEQSGNGGIWYRKS
jgi:hypothetical protein